MARKLVVEIIGDASSLERAMKKSTKTTDKFGRSMEQTQTKSKRAFGGIGRMAGFAAGAIGTAGLIGVAKTAFDEFSEAQRVSAQTAAALKSTGGAAKVTAKEIDALAEAMLKKTGIDDEAIKSSENMLLTFTKIRNETGKGNRIFDRATLAVADLATTYNKGAVPSAEQMQTASVMLGKALNDPIKGVTALSRKGIQFTEQQKDQIEVLVESGKVMEAQKFILEELNKQVGGRAAAAGKTFSGQWRILTETLNNLAGTLAAKLMPTIQRYLEMAVKWLNNSKNQKKILNTVEAAASAVATVARTLAGAFQFLNKVTGSTANTLKLLFAALLAIKTIQMVSAIAGIVGGITSIGRTAKISTAQVRLLRLSLLALRTLGPIAIAVMLVLHKKQIDSWMKEHGLGFMNKSAIENARDLGQRGRRRFMGGLGLGPRMVPAPAGPHGPLQVNVQVDGKTIARATGRHTESEQARRRRQRAHQRKSRR